MQVISLTNIQLHDYILYSLHVLFIELREIKQEKTRIVNMNEKDKTGVKVRKAVMDFILWK